MMTRYIFVSDVHGEYDKMITALNRYHFDKNKDVLVMLGDPFDRGAKSKEVLEFVLDCPKRIIVAGNHDQRLKMLMLDQDVYDIYDRQNGVYETLYSFTGKNASPYVLMAQMHTSVTCTPIRRKLWQYFDESVFAIEWSDLIAVHGWIPLMEDIVDGKTVRKFDPDWRQGDRYDWYNATWANTLDYIDKGFFPDKKMVIGHWHTNSIRAHLDGKEPQYTDKEDYSIYFGERIIALDGASNLPWGRVNVFVYITDEEPVFYDGRK